VVVFTIRPLLLEKKEKEEEKKKKKIHTWVHVMNSHLEDREAGLTPRLRRRRGDDEADLW